MDTTTLIAEAERVLHVEIFRTRSGRMYYTSNEEGRVTGYYVSMSDLRYALDVAADPACQDGVYSHWCAGTVTRRMSAQTLRRQ